MRTIRRKVYRGEREAGLGVLERAMVVHMASTNADGAPVLKTVHGVLMEDALAFHGASAGEKLECIGRQVVLCAQELVAEIPSYMTDPKRACPATTYYRSVQVHGVLEEVTDMARKAAVLQRLMERYQPEGGHVPITADDPLYTKAVRNIMVVQVSLERLNAKIKLGQNKPPAVLARIVDGLWRRGRPEDVKAIGELVASDVPMGVPAFLECGVPGIVLDPCVKRLEDRRKAAQMLEDAYWNGGMNPQQLMEAMAHSPAVVGARDVATGELVAVARAVSDWAKVAWVYDVMVAPGWRGRGVGDAVMGLLLDHPAVRGCARVLLGTRDAMGFYEGMGFEAIKPSSTTMLRRA